MGCHNGPNWPQNDIIVHIKSGHHWKKSFLTDFGPIWSAHAVQNNQKQGKPGGWGRKPVSRGALGPFQGVETTKAVGHRRNHDLPGARNDHSGTVGLKAGAQEGRCGPTNLECGRNTNNRRQKGTQTRPIGAPQKPDADGKHTLQNEGGPLM